jgi:protein O-GlcNAc transferase
LQGLETRLEAGRLTAPLFDSARLCRHVEAAYLEMWETHRRGESPRSFAVRDVAGAK